MLRSRYSRHRHWLKLEAVTAGVITGETIYHFRCRDSHCRWHTWCYKEDMWPGRPTDDRWNKGKWWIGNDDQDPFSDG